MENLQKQLLSITALAGLFVSVHAPGQVCQVEQVQRLVSPTQPPNMGYATALAMSGNTVAVGDRDDDIAAADAGAAHVYAYDGVQWNLIQTLRPNDLSADDRFGFSVEVDGNLMVIGAPNAGSGPVRHGAAYVYELIDGLWTQTIKLSDESGNDPPDVQGEQNQARKFGSAVAIDGSVIVIGAPDDSQAALFAGAVYFFRLDQGSWVQEQKFINANADQSDQLGRGVALHGSRAAAAATGEDPATAFAFEHDGLAWNLSQEIELPAGHWNDSSLIPPLALNGEELALGSPYAGLAEAGRVFIYQHNGTGWDDAIELVSPVDESGAMFGSSIALSDSHLVVGAPGADITYPLLPSEPAAQNAGAAYLFERANDQWVSLHKAITEYELASGYYTKSSSSNAHNHFGATIDIDDDVFAVGSPTVKSTDETKVNAWYAYTTHPPDCDGNGVPDICDPDCNHNRIPDDCDLALGEAHDCDADQTPDVCQETADYMLPEAGQPVVYGAAFSPIDVIWLNQFTVTPGNQIITHILIPWVLWTPDGQPVTLLIYDDPNNDGDPHDAVLLASRSVAGFNDFGLDLPFRYTAYQIEPAAVGTVGDSFFIGAYAQVPVDVYLAAAYTNVPAPMGRSWHLTAPIGKINIEDLSESNLAQQSNIHYMIRALALDCNNNGIWDQCDIDDGVSLDVNANGIPDECEPPCPGDITGDKMTNVDDLLIVINGWGECPSLPEQCPGDINIDDVVNVDDLLAVINDWGPCE